MNIRELAVTVDRLFNRDRSQLKPVNVNEVHEESLSIHDRIALYITGAVGTMWAVYIMALGMAGWMFCQAWLQHKAFDPYPYAFLLFIGNVVQLLLMPLIMVGQNIQGRHAELRAEEEYRTSVANLQDVQHLMDHMVALDRELLLHREMLTRVVQAVAPDMNAPQSTVIEGIHVSITGHIEAD
jgi:uncharacterized membrane protein